MQERDLESLIPDYREFLASRALAYTSRRQYLRAVTLFVAFLKRRQQLHPCDIRLSDLEAFRAYTKRRVAARPDRRLRPAPGLAAADGYTRAVAAFCRWLVLEEHLILDPSQDLEPVRLPTYRPQILTHAQVQTLIESVAGDEPSNLRDRAILELFYTSALRLSELLHLEVEDLDLHAREVLIRRGKGGASRRAPLGDWALEALQRYLERERPVFLSAASSVLPDTTALWLSPHGRRMSRWTLEQLVPDRAQKAGLPGRVTAHVLRHTAAVHLLHGGASVRHVQDFLGHRSAQTTVRYTTLVIDDLKEVWTLSHPRPAFREVLDASDE